MISYEVTSNTNSILFMNASSMVKERLYVNRKKKGKKKITYHK